MANGNASTEYGDRAAVARASNASAADALRFRPPPLGSRGEHVRVPLLLRPEPEVGQRPSGAEDVIAAIRELPARRPLGLLDLRNGGPAGGHDDVRDLLPQHRVTA
ncbi:hypothetical protein [Streptomyces sp. NPDC049916]|uniref:hypothetical protein n=1 Tax=Streptomyces sp. NPDC049916 TaxID=3155156 RepID=UPI00343D78BA